MAQEAQKFLHRFPTLELSSKEAPHLFGAIHELRIAKEIKEKGGNLWALADKADEATLKKYRFPQTKNRREARGYYERNVN